MGFERMRGQSAGGLIGARHLANGRLGEREAYRNAAPGRLQTQATMMPERARHPEMGQGFREDDARQTRRLGGRADGRLGERKAQTDATLDECVT